MKHHLKFRGRPYSAEGEPLAEESVSAGPGHAVCTCGELSDLLPSGGKRRKWHKQHVAEIEAARSPQPTDVPLDEGWALPAGQTEIENTTGDAEIVVEAGVLNPAEPERLDPLVELDPERDGLAAYSIHTLPMPPRNVVASSRRPGPGRHPFNPFVVHEGADAVTYVPLPPTISREFWADFGVDAARWVASVYPGVKYAGHPTVEAATLSGEDPRTVREAALSVARMFDTAGAELRHYTSTDEEYKAVPARARKTAEALRIRALRRYARRFADALVPDEGTES